MEKQQRKDVVQRAKQSARSDLLASMPFSPGQLHQLLKYLDGHLKNCDHTTRLVQAFLLAEHLDREAALSWLGDHGGYCDCEVLANLDDLDNSLNDASEVASIPISPKQKRVARSLNTVTGWNLAKLPAPWRVANLFDPTELVRLELGKKGGCAITIVESPFPFDLQSPDEIWADLWYDRTKLPSRGSLQVSRGVLEGPTEFESVLVRASAWTPVYCWVVPRGHSWHLEIKTESSRYAGDLPQISTLLSCLARDVVVE